MKKLKEPEGKKLFVPEFKLTQIDKIEWSEIPIIMDSQMSVRVLRDYITYKQLDNQINVNEFAFVIYLNRRNKVVAITHHTTGGIDGTIMDLRLIFAQSLLVGASSLILFHNHPTGNLQPSDGDRRTAQKIAQAGKIMEIQVVDFIIITSNSGYTSFLDDGISLSYAEGGYMAKGGEIAHPRINWSEYYEHGGSISDMPPRDENGERKIDYESIAQLTEYVTSLPQTKAMYFNEATGQYSPERKRLHAEIINSYKDDVVCITEGRPIAILMGGSPASGKSSFLRKYSPYLLQDEILRVDADDIRAKLPEYKGYNATQTHLETKDIVNTLISDRVIGIPCDFDLIYDGTMNSVRSYLPLIDILKKRGYLIFIVYMDNVPKDVIIDRILKRYQKTGRFVPLEVVEDFYQKGRVAFDQLKNKVDGYMVIDGNSFDYPIIEQGGMELPQERAYSMLGYPIPKETLPKEYAKGGEVGKKLPPIILKKLQEKLTISKKAINKWGGEYYDKFPQLIKDQIDGKTPFTYENHLMVQGDEKKDHYDIFIENNAIELAKKIKKIVDKYKNKEVSNTSIPSAPNSSSFMASISGKIELVVNFIHYGGYYSGNNNLLIGVKIGNGIDPITQKKIKQDMYEVMFPYDQYNSSDGGVMWFNTSGTNYDTIGLECNTLRFSDSLAEKIENIFNSKAYAKGGKMAKGGVTGYERLVKKVAANYEGKAVPSKYRSKYGKRYDADEAKKVGYAVATKVYGKPLARMAEGGVVNKFNHFGLYTDEYIKQISKEASEKISDGYLASKYGEDITKLKPWHIESLRQIFYKDCIQKSKDREEQINMENEERAERGVQAMLDWLDEDRGDRTDEEIKKEFMFNANRYAKRLPLLYPEYAEGGETDSEITAEDRMIAQQHNYKFDL